MLTWYQIFLTSNELLLAALLGGAIGFERETHGQAAGFRTNLLVCLGACLMMMLSLHLEELFRHLDSQSVVRLDPGRIASYAIASMGFLGAGAIIKGKGSVRGLTTAAGLWLATGIGLAVGAGYIVPALVTTLVSLLILFLFRSFKIYFSHDVYTILTLSVHTGRGSLEQIMEILYDYSGIDIRFVNYRRSLIAKMVEYRLRLCSKEHLPWREIVARLQQLPGLQEIRWEESDVP